MAERRSIGDALETLPEEKLRFIRQRIAKASKRIESGKQRYTRERIVGGGHHVKATSE